MGRRLGKRFVSLKRSTKIVTKSRKIAQRFVTVRGDVWGNAGETIRETKFRSVTLNVSTKLGETIFFKVVSPNFFGGDDWG